MSSPNENIENSSEQTKDKCNSRALINSFIITFAVIATSTLVYFTIKEGHRVKLENELLEYEVW